MLSDCSTIILRIGLTWLISVVSDLIISDEYRSPKAPDIWRELMSTILCCLCHYHTRPVETLSIFVPLRVSRSRSSVCPQYERSQTLWRMMLPLHSCGMQTTEEVFLFRGFTGKSVQFFVYQLVLRSTLCLANFFTPPNHIREDRQLQCEIFVTICENCQKETTRSAQVADTVCFRMGIDLYLHCFTECLSMSMSYPDSWGCSTPSSRKSFSQPASFLMT